MPFPCIMKRLKGSLRGCARNSRTKNQPKEEVFGADIPRTTGGHLRGYPGPKLRSGQLKSWKKNKHVRADIHDPKARTATTLRDFQKLRSGKLWAEFSFPSNWSKGARFVIPALAHRRIRHASQVCFTLRSLSISEVNFGFSLLLSPFLMTLSVLPIIVVVIKVNVTCFWRKGCSECQYNLKKKLYKSLIDTRLAFRKWRIWTRFCHISRWIHRSGNYVLSG